MTLDFDDEDEAYNEDDAEFGTIKCTSCGEDVFEDAPQCPECGAYITLCGRGVLSNRPLWFVVLAFLGAVFLIRALLMG